MERKKCKIEGCSYPVWSGGLCSSHNKKKPMKRFSGRQSGKTHLIMHEFFLYIWRKRKHKSEVSGKYLGKEPLSIYFHHILPKSKYKQAAFDPENIILLTSDEHNNVENDMYKYEEVNKRRKKLLIKYDLI
jgi:5-methylcytosine-specific restriction endonuclease McrA